MIVGGDGNSSPTHMRGCWFEPHLRGCWLEIACDDIHCVTLVNVLFFPGIHGSQAASLEDYVREGRRKLVYS